MELQPDHHYVLNHLGSGSDIQDTRFLESLKHSEEHTYTKFSLNFRISKDYI